MVVLAAVGCARGTGTDKQAASPVRASVEPKSLPKQITNQFGMTFRLVTIDSSLADHRDSFPARSYYLQKTTLTGEQHSAFRMAAFGEGTYETINWHFNGGYPSEWREWYRYAQALSKFDTEYDYRLPSRSQWQFACRNGYEQRCDKAKPNVYGVEGLIDTNGFAEAVDDLILHNGYEFAVLMGYWKDNWGEHSGEEKPDCPCEYWTACNPDADDSLNELITGRFVLIPNRDVARTKVSVGQPIEAR